MQCGERSIEGERKSSANSIDRSLLYVTELLHRVQNDYTKAISLASAMALRSPNIETKATLSQMVDYLHASADAHRLLLPRLAGDRIDFAEDVTRLCRTMAAADLNEHGITLHLTIFEPILLDGPRCWRANLILSELITNAARHAFSLCSGGRITVAIRIACDQVVCTVSDDGGSVQKPKPGLGSRLVDALAEDLEGGVERCYTECGTVITLNFPMEPESERHRLNL